MAEWILNQQMERRIERIEGVVAINVDHIQKLYDVVISLTQRIENLENKFEEWERRIG